MPVVHTERLVLRGLTDDDLDAWARLQADPRIAGWLGGQPQDREDAWRTLALFVGHWALRGHGQWAMVERATGALLGRVGLWQPEGWPGLEVGWMVDADRWGEGFATEGGRASVDWAFTRLDVDEVISITTAHNLASRRVMAKLGLRDTGTIVHVRGHDQVCYRIRREEWDATQA